jgi:hypothetical protein
MVAAPKGDEEDDTPPANILKHLRDRGPTTKNFKFLQFQTLKFHFLKRN